MWITEPSVNGLIAGFIVTAFIVVTFVVIVIVRC